MPNRPGNVYSEDRHPTDILWDYERLHRGGQFLPPALAPEWRRLRVENPTFPRNVTGEPDPDALRRMRENFGITPLPDGTERNVWPHHAPTPNAPDTSMEPEDEESLLTRISREGGIKLLNFLMAQHAVAYNLQPEIFKDLHKLATEAHNCWLKACLEELAALRKRGVYELVDLPKGRKAIGNRWVFNTKSDGHLHARLVAQGFSQVKGIDFDELFSPVVRYETV